MARVIAHNRVMFAINDGHQLQGEVPIEVSVLVDAQSYFNAVRDDLHKEFIRIPGHRDLSRATRLWACML